MWKKWAIVLGILFYSLHAWPQDSLQISNLYERINEVSSLNLPLQKKDSLLRSLQSEALSSDNDSLAAFAEHRLGVIYFSAKDFKKAHYHYNTAFDLRKQLPFINLERLTRSGYFAGLSAVLANDLETGKRHFLTVLSYPAHRYGALSYIGLARAHHYAGAYDLSESYFKQAISNNDLLTNTDLFSLQLDYMGMKIEQNDSTKYADVIRSSLDLFDTLESEIEGGEISEVNRLRYYQNLALLLDKTADYGRAMEFNKRALAIDLDPLERADIYVNLGNIYRRTGKTGLAESLIRQAKAAYENAGETKNIALSYDNLAEIYLVKKEFERAHILLDSAITVLLERKFEGLDENSIQLSPSIKYDLAIYLGDKARGYYQWYESEYDKKNLDYCLQYYQYADQVIDLLRKDFAQEDLQLHWRKRASKLYQPAVQAALHADSVELALSFIDRNKALVLTEAIQRSRAIQLIPDSITNKLAEISKEVTRLEKILAHAELSAKTGDKEIALLRDSLLVTRERYSGTHKELLTNYPHYSPEYNFQLEEIRQNLRSDQAVLSYFLGEDSVYCIKLDQFHLRHLNLGNRITLDTLLFQLRSLLIESEIHSAPASSPSEAEYNTHLSRLAYVASALYEFLLGGWNDLPENLMIIPDGGLHHLNFEMLLSRWPDTGDALFRWPFAIREHCFTYNHSLSNWMELLKRGAPKGHVLGIAPTIHPPFQALPKSQAGLEGIRGFKLKLLIGNNANREKIASFGQNSILDFQTHAVIDEEYNSNSFILINNKDGSGDSLFLRDIYHFLLPSSYVILSACETHVGDYAQGEGIISLARAFNYAGATSLVTSLWKVDDHASARILTAFYKEMGKEESVDQALRKAKLHFLENSLNEQEEHPFYWASLVQIGNTMPVKSRVPVLLYALSAFALLLIGFLIWKRSAKQR